MLGLRRISCRQTTCGVGFGADNMQFRFNGPADVAVRYVFAALAGALLRARAFRGFGRFEVSIC